MLNIFISNCQSRGKQRKSVSEISLGAARARPWQGTGRRVAGTQGFEPRYAAPEAAVLPLDDVPTELHSSKGGARKSNVGA